MGRISWNLLGAAAVLWTGCIPAYIPPAMHAPILEAKDDMRTVGSFGSHGGQVDVAYALTDSIGLRATTQLADGKHGYDRYRMGRVGISRFQTGRHGNRSAWSFEAGGAVWAGAFVPESTNSGRVSAVFFRGQTAMIVGQYEVGRAWKYVELVPAVRATYLHTRYQSHIAGEGVLTLDNLVIEPTLTFRTGFQRVKLDVQLGFPVPLKRDFGDLFNTTTKKYYPSIGLSMAL